MKILVMVSLLILITSVFVIAYVQDEKDDPINEKELIARWTFWGQILGEEKSIETICNEDKLNLPEDKRTFPYLRSTECDNNGLV